MCRGAAEKQGRRAPCDGCIHAPPELTPETRDVWQLWQASQTQWRVGMAGATGLDYVAVASLAHTLRIDWGSPRVLRLMQHLEAETLSRIHRET